MERNPSWHLYPSFLAAVRQGSLSGAARQLRLTQPTLGRHIEELEAELGTSLFTRSQGGLAPTPAALSLVPLAEVMEAAAAALVRSAEGSGGEGEARGTVRITASEIMGAEVLPPILSSIQARHPGIVLELVLNNRTENLLRRDADIAVRMMRPGQEAVLAKRIGEVQIGLYAHRDYLARHGAPGSVEELPRSHVIGFDRDDRSARAATAGKLPIDRTLFSFRSDSDLAQAAALRAGLGIGAMQVGLARRHPELVPVLADRVCFTLEMWLAMHEDLRRSHPVRVVYERLAEGLGEWVRREGEGRGG